MRIRHLSSDVCSSDRARHDYESEFLFWGTEEGVRFVAEPLDLYFWPTPNGWRITIMLEETGLPYRLAPVDLSRGEQVSPAFLRIPRNGRMPALVAPAGPDGAPISIFESGAIRQYPADTAGRFYPTSPRATPAVHPRPH